MKEGARIPVDDIEFVGYLPGNVCIVVLKTKWPRDHKYNEYKYLVTTSNDVLNGGPYERIAKTLRGAMTLASQLVADLHLAFVFQLGEMVKSGDSKAYSGVIEMYSFGWVFNRLLALA